MVDFAPISAVTIRPREPYYEWARETSDGVSVDPQDWQQDPNVYLLPNAESTEHLMEHVRRYYGRIWRTELALWDEDESRWPVEPTIEEFLEWFAVIGHTGVVDLVAT